LPFFFFSFLLFFFAIETSLRPFDALVVDRQRS